MRPFALVSKKNVATGDVATRNTDGETIMTDDLHQDDYNTFIYCFSDKVPLYLVFYS